MDEHSAAATGDARARVVVDLDDQVVKAVVAPEAVASFIGRPAEWPIVAAVMGIFAPCIRRRDAARRQQGARPPQPVRAPPQPQRPKLPARGAAVALSLVGADAGAAERDRNG